MGIYFCEVRRESATLDGSRAGDEGEIMGKSWHWFWENGAKGSDRITTVTITLVVLKVIGYDLILWRYVFALFLVGFISGVVSGLGSRATEPDNSKRWPTSSER